MKRILLLVLTTLLVVVAGCKETQQSQNTSWTSAGIYYTYPLNHQVDVSPSAPVVLGYMGKVALDPNGSDFALNAVKMDGSPLGSVPNIRVKPVNNGTGAVLSFVTSSDEVTQLTTGATYTLTIAPTSPLVNSKDPALPQGGLVFTVRPDHKGPITKRWSANDFKVESFTPADTPEQPMLDFSSIRLTFTHPVDEQTIKYGDTVKLEQNGDLVPATVLVNGRYLTIDPENAAGDSNYNHDLAPNVPVNITLSQNIKDQSGSPLAAEFTKTLLPQDTTPRSMMVQTAAGTDCSATDPQTIVSPLSGEPINCVPVMAKLLGDTTVSSQASDGVYAQLAQLAKFPDTAPLRLTKGSMLKGGALSVLIGGQVDAGYDSGEVTVTFISDANGYMVSNPYTNNPNAYKLLSIEMDVAFDTRDPRANGAFTQNLLHIKLVGRAQIDTEEGVLKADAIAVVEPEVLGLETGYGVLSFHMESYVDQTNLPVPGMPEPDDRPLALSSWVPGVVTSSTINPDGTVKQTDELDPIDVGDTDNIADMLRPGNPIILTFNKPLDPSSIRGGDAADTADATLRLEHNGADVDFSWYLDGTSIVIRPHSLLEYSKQEVSGGVINSDYPSTYRVIYTNDIRDIRGEGTLGQALTFTMPVFASLDDNKDSSSDGHSPVITAIYPGFPCVTTARNITNNLQGRCLGGKSSDDILPIPTMPANRSIHVSFSQVIDNVELGQNFLVEKCDESGICNEVVEGELQVNGMDLSFTPDNKWALGALYRYTVKSGNQASLPSLCASKQAVCSAITPYASKAHPVKTAMLQQPGYDQGGPNLEIYFRGAEVTTNVLQQLKQFPVSDVDGSFVHNVGEPNPGYPGTTFNDAPVNPRALLNSTKLLPGSASGAMTEINVGCSTQGNDCPNDKFLYMTGALNADIIGFKSADDIANMISVGDLKSADTPQAAKDNGGVLTYIYPTQIITTSVSTFAKALISNSNCNKWYAWLVCQILDATGMGELEIPTGAQVMRIRYQNDRDNKPAPLAGWIVEENGSPVFKTILHVYMDAPYLSPELLGSDLDHELHSYPLTINLSGALTFLPDGRLQIEQKNTEALSITTSISMPALFNAGVGNMTLNIPQGGINLNYAGMPIKQ